VLVLDEDVIAENTYGEGRVNVRGEFDWAGDHETDPTTLDPGRARIPLVTTPAYEGPVAPSDPIVDPGGEVTAGEMIVTPGGDGIGNAQHASIGGTVTAVTGSHIEITAASETGDASVAADADLSRGVYWTWCSVCEECR
jgi:hypothetical protein